MLLPRLPQSLAHIPQGSGVGSDHGAQYSQLLFTSYRYPRTSWQYDDGDSDSDSDSDETDKHEPEKTHILEGPATLRAFLERGNSRGEVLRFLQARASVISPDLAICAHTTYTMGNLLHENTVCLFRTLWAPGPFPFSQACESNKRSMTWDVKAIFSFSASNDVDDSIVIVPSIVLQLATQVAPYRRFITSVLASDPNIFRRSLHVQFTELLFNPFRLQLMETDNRLAYSKPYTIVLDGLDKCKDVALQQDIVELVCRFYSAPRDFLLHWVICGRADSSTIPLMSDPDWPILDRLRFELEDCDMWSWEGDEEYNPRDEREAHNYITERFEDMTQRFAYQLGMNIQWPSELHMREILRVATKNVPIASLILRYISDIYASDPRRRLDECLHLIRSINHIALGETDQVLDTIYHHILSKIPPRDRRIAMDILGFIIQYGLVTPFCLSNFLCLDKRSFYRILRPIRCLLSLPAPVEIGSERGSLYGTVGIQGPTFTRFLLDPRRSGKNCLKDGEFCYRIASCAIEWLNKVGLYQDPDRRIDQGGCIISYDHEKEVELPSAMHDLPWRPRYDLSCEGFASWLREFLIKHIWTTCIRTPDWLAPKLLRQLGEVNFAELGGKLDIRWEMSGYDEFLRWLYHHDSKHPWLSQTAGRFAPLHPQADAGNNDREPELEPIPFL